MPSCMDAKVKLSRIDCNIVKKIYDRKVKLITEHNILCMYVYTADRNFSFGAYYY